MHRCWLLRYSFMSWSLYFTSRSRRLHHQSLHLRQKRDCLASTIFGLATGERVFHELRVATYDNPFPRQRVKQIHLLMVRVAEEMAQHRSCFNRFCSWHEQSHAWHLKTFPFFSNGLGCVHTSCGGLYCKQIHVIARENEVVDVDQNKRHR